MSSIMRNRIRRGVVRGALGACVVALVLAACQDPTAPAGGLNAESTAAGTPTHTHRATVPFDDIDAPPSGGTTYTTTSGGGHTHNVHLSATNLTDLQQRGAVVSVGTTGGPGDHQHTFTFVR